MTEAKKERAKTSGPATPEEEGLEIPAEEAEAGAPEGEASPPGAGPEEAAAPEAELARLKDQLLRALAEGENLRRRAEREREEVAKFAIAGFARDILSVADNLRRALENIPAHTREQDPNLDALAVGVEATERELMAAFERHGIRKIEPLGEKFDHDLHHAMFELEDTGKPAGTVVELMQPGYVLQERLLRPALVGIAKGEPRPAPEPAPGGEPEGGPEGDPPKGVDTTV